MIAQQNRRARGSAMITVIWLMAILAIIVATLMLMAMHQRRQATATARRMPQLSCAEAGLQYAKSFYGRQQMTWNTFLANGAKYNAPTNAAIATLLAGGTANELFVNLDGAANPAPDVYIFVRDNDDELPPAPFNSAVDNDQNVVVGAVCISSTMAPRNEDGSAKAEALVVESILSWNMPGNTYKSQGGVGATGTGNFN